MDEMDKKLGPVKNEKWIVGQFHALQKIIKTFLFLQPFSERFINSKIFTNLGNLEQCCE